MSRGKKKPWETNPQAESAKAKKQELEKIGRVKSDPFGKGVFIDEAVKLNIEEFAKFTWKDVTTTPEGAEFGFKPGDVYKIPQAGFYNISATGIPEGVERVDGIPVQILEAGIPIEAIKNIQAEVYMERKGRNVRFTNIPNKIWAFYPDGRILDTSAEVGETVLTEVPYEENLPKKPTDDWADNWAKKQGGQDGVESLKSV